MLTPTTITFRTWLNHYERSYDANHFIEMIQTNTRALLGMITGESENVEHAIDKLLEFPYFATFVGYLDENKAVQVQVVHHFFKSSPPGIPFQEGNEAVYAIRGLGVDAEAIIFPLTVFAPSADLRGRTPTLADFKYVAGDWKKTESLRCAPAPTPEEITADQLANGDPLPMGRARRCGGIIPPFLVPCFKSGNPAISLHAMLTEIKDYADEELDDEEKDNFWKAAYPILQRLWFMTLTFSDARFPNFFAPGFAELNTTPGEDWATEKGKFIASQYSIAHKEQQNETTATITQENLLLPPNVTTAPIPPPNVNGTNTVPAVAGGAQTRGNTTTGGGTTTTGNQHGNGGNQQQQGAATGATNQGTVPPNQQPTAADILQQILLQQQQQQQNQQQHQAAGGGGTYANTIQHQGGGNQQTQPPPGHYHFQQQNQPIDPTLVAILASLSDVCAKQVAQASDRESGEGGQGRTPWKNRFSVLKQNLLLFASATSEKQVPKEPAEAYLVVLESKKEQAHYSVQHAINKVKGGTQSIDLAFSTSLYNGNLSNVEGSGGTPQGLSTFFSVPAPIVRDTTAMGSEELDLCIKTNNLTAAQIKSLTKSQVQVPAHGYMVRETLENHLYTIDFLFGDKSHIYCKLAWLIGETKKHRRKFDEMFTNKPAYVACLLQAIDIKIQLFLESCSTAATVDEVNFAVLDFAKEANSFLLQEPLNTHLPLIVQQLVNAMNAPKGDSPTGRNKRGGGGKGKVTDEDIVEKSKRKKGEGADGKGGKPSLNTEVKNTSPVDPSWIKKNESYKVFSKHVETVPTLNGKAICIKYHVKGACGWGENCTRKNTHTDKFDDDTKEKFDTWIKMCRGKTTPPEDNN